MLLSCKSIEDQANKQGVKIDSVVNYHLSILSRIAYAKPGEEVRFDPPVDTRESVLFFEKLTGIASYADASTFPKKYASKEEINSWKEWIESNKTLLIWEDSFQRVNRSDTNMYTD